MQVIASKVEKGATVTSDDVQQLRALVTQDRQAIPYLNRSLLLNNPGSSHKVMVVRYVGMVQDMLETEYYLSHVNGIATHYREVYSNENDDDLKNGLQNMVEFISERQPLVLVPLPFSSPWFNNITLGLAQDKNGQSPEVTPERLIYKRERETDDMNLTSKRQFAHDEETNCRPTCNGANSTIDWWPAGCMKSDVGQSPVLAKMYYDQPHYETECRHLRLNDLVEVIGVISPPPIDTGDNHTHPENDENHYMEDDASDEEGELLLELPPPNFLPRLHVLTHHVLDVDIMTANAIATADGVLTPRNDSALQRADVVDDLAKLLLDGDAPAAEAVLMALLSQAEREKKDDYTWSVIKTPYDTSLGCASLNLVASNATDCQRLFQKLYHALQQVLPVVAVLDAANEVWGTPRKDKTGRLVPSPLQLPKGSTLLIHVPDPNSLSPTLQEALKTLTGSHTLSFHFGGYFKHMMEADYRIVVVSAKPLKTCLMTVRVTKDVTPLTAGDADKQQPLLERIRLYFAQRRWSTLANSGYRDPTMAVPARNIVLTPEILVQAQHDFVSRRVASRNGVSKMPQAQEEDLHRWLTLTRLEARSRCHLRPDMQNVVATVEDWNSALRLDDAISTFK